MKNTTTRSEKLTKLKKAELLEDFKVEELEQRFEMGWFRSGVEQTIEVEPASGDTYLPDGNGNVSSESWYGVGATWTFLETIKQKLLIMYFAVLFNN
ncbi:hypothetical protein C7E23_12305 [Elizabethkingia anophelis]|nr:hypothetical protein C7E23_12305 [Elizabethkingia anophelis]